MLSIAAVLASSVVMAAPLHPLQGAQELGTMSVAPGIEVNAEGISPSTGFSGALGHAGDLNLAMGTGLSFANGSTTLGDGFVDFMPRYFVHPSTALAAHVTYAGSEVGFGAEVHNVIEAGSFTLTTNLGWAGALGDHAFAPGEAFAMVAPEIAFNDFLSLFTEVNPAVATGVPDAEAGLSLVPGVCANLDPECPVPLISTGGVPAQLPGGSREIPSVAGSRPERDPGRGAGTGLARNPCPMAPA